VKQFIDTVFVEMIHDTQVAECRRYSTKLAKVFTQCANHQPVRRCQFQAVMPGYGHRKRFIPLLRIIEKPFPVKHGYRTRQWFVGVHGQASMLTGIPLVNRGGKATDVHMPGAPDIHNLITNE
jgi:hypothetical protein